MELGLECEHWARCLMNRVEVPTSDFEVVIAKCGAFGPLKILGNFFGQIAKSMSRSSGDNGAASVLCIALWPSALGLCEQASESVSVCARGCVGVSFQRSDDSLASVAFSFGCFGCVREKKLSVPSLWKNRKTLRETQVSYLCHHHC